MSQPAPLKVLKGKVAYITASSDGIGLGIARAAANAGMKVCIGYRNEERLAAAVALFKKDQEVFPVKHDVTDRDGWVKVLEQIKAQVRQAASAREQRRRQDARQGERREAAKNGTCAVAVNYTAIYNSVAVCLPHMLEHGEGSHILCTSSMSGLLPGGNLGVYTATKIAAVGLMEALRVELEGTTVGTSAFVPGGVNTDNYFASGEENPYRAAQAAKNGQRDRAAHVRPSGMDPLECRRARAQRRGEQRSLHRHASRVHAGHEGALRRDPRVGAGGRHAAAGSAREGLRARAARGHLSRAKSSIGRSPASPSVA